MYYIGYGPCNSIYYEVPNSNFAYRRPSGTNFNLYESERYVRQCDANFVFLNFVVVPLAMACTQSRQRLTSGSLTARHKVMRSYCLTLAATTICQLFLTSYCTVWQKEMVKTFVSLLDNKTGVTEGGLYLTRTRCMMYCKCTYVVTVQA